MVGAEPAPVGQVRILELLAALRAELLENPATEPGASFQRIVSTAVDADRLRLADQLPLPSYGTRATDYREHSWISFTDPRSQVPFAFVGLVAATVPFDSVELVEADPRTGRSGGTMRIPWAAYTFRLVRRTARGEVSETSDLEPGP